MRGGEDIRVKGDETPVEETSDDAREAVDGGLLGEINYDNVPNAANIAENVKNLVGHDNGKTFQIIKNTLK